MPRVTPEAKTKWYLFRGNKSDLERQTGIKRRTLYDRIEKPGNIKLSELGQLVKANDLTDEQIIKIVRAWK